MIGREKRKEHSKWVVNLSGLMWIYRLVILPRLFTSVEERLIQKINLGILSIYILVVLVFLVRKLTDRKLIFPFVGLTISLFWVQPYLEGTIFLVAMVPSLIGATVLFIIGNLLDQREARHTQMREEKMLKEAQAYTIKKHGSQKRIQGTPYYEHPFQVAQYLKENNYGIEYQLTALFHDLLEDTDATEEEMIKLSSKKVVEAVLCLTKKKGMKMEEYIDAIRSNKVAKPVKLADRIHNLSEASMGSIPFRKKYITETKEWYLPLAEKTIFYKELEWQLSRVNASLENKMEGKKGKIKNQFKK